MTEPLKQDQRVIADTSIDGVYPDGTAYVVTVPICPPFACSPNAKTKVVGYDGLGKPIKKGIHWSEKAAAVASFREMAGWSAVDGRMNYQGLTLNDTYVADHPIFSGPVSIHARIGWSKGRKTQDTTNAAASLKAAIDGLQDANIFANDKQVKRLDVDQERDKKGVGYVVFTVTPLEEQS